MSVRVGPYEFDFVLYDDDRDAMNLAIGEGKGALNEDTFENYFWFHDDDGEVVGLILQDVRAQIEREGGVYVTLPDGGERVRSPDAEAVVASPELYSIEALRAAGKVE